MIIFGLFSMHRTYLTMIYSQNLIMQKQSYCSNFKKTQILYLYQHLQMNYIIKSKFNISIYRFILAHLRDFTYFGLRYPYIIHQNKITHFRRNHLGLFSCTQNGMAWTVLNPGVFRVSCSGRQSWAALLLRLADYQKFTRRTFVLLAAVLGTWACCRRLPEIFG